MWRKTCKLTCRVNYMIKKKVIGILAYLVGLSAVYTKFTRIWTYVIDLNGKVTPVCTEFGFSEIKIPYKNGKISQLCIDNDWN